MHRNWLQFPQWWQFHNDQLICVRTRQGCIISRNQGQIQMSSCRVQTVVQRRYLDEKNNGRQCRCGRCQYMLDRGRTVTVDEGRLRAETAFIHRIHNWRQHHIQWTKAVSALNLPSSTMTHIRFNQRHCDNYFEVLLNYRHENGDVHLSRTDNIMRY